MNRQVVLTGPRQLIVENLDLVAPATGQVRVRNRVSAISAGTEGLLWLGEFPPGIALDPVLKGYQRPFSYPVSYGYAAVGSVEACGAGVTPELLGRRVFTFTAHQSHVTLDAAGLVLLPDELEEDDAVLLASMETAVCLGHDAAVLAGERVGVVGLGPVGQLVAALLAEFPASVTAWDPIEFRRRAAASAVQTQPLATGEFDTVVDLSGCASGLESALAALRFSGTLVLGSWFGARPVALDLGGAFHRSRIRMISSQVSTISPELSGRWSKARRLDYALACLRRLKPSRLITHRIPVERAAQAYELAAERPDECVQVLITYD